MGEHVVDANVFIHATDLALQIEEPVTVPAVVEELESSAARQRYELEGVDVYAPAEEHVEQVEREAAELGEELSDADTAVLALALGRDAVLVTDDYGLQNVAASLGVAYEGFAKEEIEEQIAWTTVCASCGAAVEGDRCSRCGGEPERVPREE